MLAVDDEDCLYRLAVSLSINHARLAIFSSFISVLIYTRKDGGSDVFTVHVASPLCTTFSIMHTIYGFLLNIEAIFYHANGQVGKMSEIEIAPDGVQINECLDSYYF